ncbi:MAG: hypothetical protein ACRDKT_13930 [Actinomycetota bacterium]
MRRLLVIAACAVVAMASLPPGEAATRSCPRPGMHAAEKHASQDGHRRECGLELIGSIEVSKTGGLGQIERYGDLIAVLQRDEGIVALVNVRDRRRARVVGRYDDGAQDSLDGDLVFSDDGRWLFYARQTVQFSRDGIHVLDVSDPKEPRLASYHPGGGSFRVAYHRSADAEYVAVLDAIDGLVIYRFIREAGALTRVFQDALPALKVGGPSSAGLFIDPKDPKTGAPLMYVATGRTGLQIYDISTPEAPEIAGTWNEIGLSDVEVRATKRGRTVWGATEYWFDAGLKPEVVVLDATDLGAIKQTNRLSLGLPAEDTWRVQGIARSRGSLVAAHSHAGVVVFRADGSVPAAASSPFDHNAEAGAAGSVYAMDVESVGSWLFVTDASTGRLHFYEPPPIYIVD